MKNIKLISIIIPVFNNNKGLEKCLLAISKQQVDLSKVEVIVVDNASIKSPVNLVKKFKFAKYTYEEKIGSYAARNKGARIAEGNDFFFLDADCIPAKEWLKHGMTLLHNSEAKTIIGGDVLIQKPEKSTSVALYQFITGFQQKENIALRGFAVTANIFMKRTAFETVGNFNEDLLSGGDREWCFRATNLGYKIKFCKEAIVYTPPRYTFHSAVIQARRTAGGRFQLQSLIQSTAESSSNSIAPHRSILESIKWILKSPDLSFLESQKVLLVAIMLKIITLFEFIRLKIGFSAERA